MRLWSIQDEAMMVAAKKRGYLTGDGRYNYAVLFRKPYRWLLQQMQQRIPGCKGRFPIWAWEQKPDLRHRHGVKGQKLLLLTLEIPAERVLLSDFQAWHFVLNNWFLPLTPEDWKPVDWHNHTPEEQRIITQSWVGIFDLEALYKSSGFQGDKDVQAVIERVELKEIVQIRGFISK